MKRPKLETVEMIKCESCGGYHPESESEIVVIRIIKGKKCDINQVQNSFTSPPRRALDTQEIKPVMVDDHPLTNAPRPRNIIPAAISSMMLPPDHPDFESKGAKERRRV